MEEGKLPGNSINQNALRELLEEHCMSLAEMIVECRANRRMALLLAQSIAKKSTRQGTQDERLQLSVCNETAMKCGIHISNLGVCAYRPTKSGEILSQPEIVARNVQKNECLKSFDGKITGAISGWIFAKIVYGSGGHQDNVFEETDTMCEWVKTFRNPMSADVFIMLIDTDQIKKKEMLQTKYKDVVGLYIFDHVEFQQYIINFTYNNV
jgi:hypothetical protein